MLQSVTEEVKLLVIALLLPISIEGFQNLFIMAEHFNEIRLEIVGLIQDVAFLVAFLHGQFNNLVKFHAFGLQLLHIQFWGYDHFVFSKHLQHVIRDAKKCCQR